jgi:DNA polymerase III delta prime subunit
MTMNRDKLQEQFIQWDLSQMSLDDLQKYFVDMQNAELDSLTDDELIDEVNQYNPSLLQT